MNRNYYILSALVLIVVALSVFVFSRQSLRLDEAQSLWQTSHSIKTVIGIVAEDVHVPLYHVILHFWQFMFGNGVATARALSLIFFVLMIPALYMYGKLVSGHRVALFSVALLSISPFLNWYGNEIRMYSLFALLTILNQFFFASIFIRTGEDDEVRNGIWVGYAITTVLGMFTHYFFAFNLITQAIFYVAYRKIFPAQSFKKFILVVVLLAATFGPWLYYVYTLGSARNSQPLLSEPTTIDIFNVFSQFIFGFQNDHINTILVSLWPLLVLLIFLSLKRSKRVLPQTVFLFFCLFLPIIMIYAVSVGLRPIFLTRYLILTLPSLYLLIGWILSTYSDKLARSLKAALIIAMLVMLSMEIVNANTPVKENYRQASTYISTRASAEDIVVLSAPFTIYPFEYYYRGSASVDTIPRWNRLERGPIPPFTPEKLPTEVETIKDNHRLAWVLLSYDQGYEKNVLEYFDKNFERLTEMNFSPKLNLYIYRLRYDGQSREETLRNLNVTSVPVPSPIIVIPQPTSTQATSTATTSAATTTSSTTKLEDE